MKTSVPKLLAIILLFVLAACEQVETGTTSKGTTNNKKDSISLPNHPAKTKTEILTYKPWIMEEEYDMEGNILNTYERGAAGNTMNYDNEVLTFTTSNTGSFQDIYGQNYPITWQFTNAKQTKMTVIIYFPNINIKLNYNMVQISDSSFSMTFNHINPTTGRTVLVTAKRVWKPNL